jgi:hypothetical protein
MNHQGFIDLVCEIASGMPFTRVSDATAMATAPRRRRRVRCEIRLFMEFSFRSDVALTVGAGRVVDGGTERRGH